MKLAIALFILLATLGIKSGYSSPIDDLASPRQDIRGKAAEELRKSYRITPKEKWTPTVAKIRKGDTKVNIENLLSPFKVKKEGGIGTGQSYSESYRLDNDWILVCWFENEGDILIARELARKLKYVWISPADDFSGKWVTYFINGEKSHEISYKNGRYFGEFISYHSDGSKSVVQHYSAEGADGKDTGYYPSGRVKYTAQYKDGKPVGVWTWYDESGEITSTQKHSNP